MSTPTSPSSMWGPGPPFEVDPPLQQDAQYQPNRQDRAYIDSQALANETHLTQSLINGVICTWAILDSLSADGAVGQVVCLAGSLNGTVTLATSAALTAAGSAFGVLVTPGISGGPVRVARLGLLQPAITGLPVSGANLYAKVNTSNATITTAASLGAGDYPLGAVDAAGNLNLEIQFTPLASANTPWLVPQSVSGAGTVTAGASKMVFVDASGGTCTVNAPSVAANVYWGVCDGKAGSPPSATFNASHGASIPNASHIIEDPNNPGVYTTNPIVMLNPSQSAIWLADPSATFFKLVG